MNNKLVPLLLASFLLVAGGTSLSAFGSREVVPPEVAVQIPETAYISPGVADGVQDGVEIPFSVTPAKRRVIKGYRLSVIDAAGDTVYSREAAGPPKGRTPVELPPSLGWDGTLADGSAAPEGSYTLTVEAWDNKAAIGRAPALAIVVDNTAPAVTLSAPYAIFSPNGDGNQDILVIEQSGSSAPEWIGRFLGTGGTEVVRRNWRQQEPQSFTWDGLRPDGQPWPDGSYRYEITATDPAGNSTTASIEPIVIDNRDTPIGLSIDRRLFSPNGDGVMDTVSLIPNVPVIEGIREWSLTIEDAGGAVRRQYRGGETAPAQTAFDGKAQDGSPLKEGTYRARLAVLYFNGNNPSAPSPVFELDVTAPAANTSADLSVFSPNGDGNKDTVTVRQTVGEELEWSGLLTDASGQTVRSFAWKGRPEAQLVWTGTGVEGNLLPDGQYTYVLTAADRAGNTGASRPLRIELNTEATEVLVSVDAAEFSPNGDGVKDRVRIIPSLKVAEGVESYELAILGAQEQSVRSFRGTGAVPSEFTWDGLDNDRNPLPDGWYLAEFRLRYVKGDFHVVRTPAFAIDNLPPEIRLAADYLLFSPDGDGRRDTVVVQQTSSKEDHWEGTIVPPSGTPVRSYVWNGQAGNLSWDGKDENGNPAPDGMYSYRVRSTDRAGNGTTAELSGIRIDTRPISLVVNPSATGFSPNADGVRDTLTFSLYATPNEEVESWSLSVMHATTKEGRTFSGARGEPVPAIVTWDGRTAQGLVVEGAYSAILQVSYAKGNLAEAGIAQGLLVDVTAPQVKVSVAPTPFSPDGDGVDDRLTIRLEAVDTSALESWGLTILDPANHEFIVFSGKGAPSGPVTWDGRSSKGELVEAAQDYTANITVRDALGNIRYAKETIPVDVLVVREGDRLKIRISSIQFAANSADFSDFDPVASEKNQRTLKRLAEILNKYGTYKILIEGHAVEVYWNNPTLAKQEEEGVLLPLSAKRAEAVKKALVALGIKADRITTAGLGGSQPVVPHGDLENRWKNRRVEFILIEESRQ